MTDEGQKFEGEQGPFGLAQFVPDKMQAYSVELAILAGARRWLGRYADEPPTVLKAPLSTVKVHMGLICEETARMENCLDQDGKARKAGDAVFRELQRDYKRTIDGILRIIPDLRRDLNILLNEILIERAIEREHPGYRDKPDKYPDIDFDEERRVLRNLAGNLSGGAKNLMEFHNMQKRAGRKEGWKKDEPSEFEREVVQDLRFLLGDDYERTALKIDIAQNATVMERLLECRHPTYMSLTLAAFIVNKIMLDMEPITRTLDSMSKMLAKDIGHDGDERGR